MIVGDVDTKAFINTMHQSQAEVEIATPGDTLRDFDAKASADTLADSRESLRDTDGFKGRMTFLKAGHRAGKGKSQDRIRHGIEAEALAETLADRLEELSAGKVGQTLTDLKAASPVVTLAPTIAEMKTQTAAKTLSDVVPQALVETQAVAVAEEVTETIKDTITYVKPEAQVEKVVETSSDCGRLARW